MSNHGERLPYASVSGAALSIEISSSQWHELELALGRPILLGARESFQAICDEYLSNERLEQAAVKVSDVKRCADSVNASLTPFMQFAYGQRMPPNGVSDNAWDEFRSQFEDILESMAIPAPAMLEHGNSENRAHAIFLSNNMMMEMVIRVSAALARIQKGGGLTEAFEAAEGLVVGAAFRAFTNVSKAWAKNNDLPYGSVRSIDNSAAPFADFLLKVIQLMPQGIAPPVDSAQAMAERIRRANR